MPAPVGQVLAIVILLCPLFVKQITIFLAFLYKLAEFLNLTLPKNYDICHHFLLFFNIFRLRFLCIFLLFFFSKISFILLSAFDFPAFFVNYPSICLPKKFAAITAAFRSVSVRGDFSSLFNTITAPMASPSHIIVCII